MMRLFRNVKAKVTVPMNDSIIRVADRADEIEQKIAELNSQLLSCKTLLATMPECPSKKMVKAKAIRLLKRKRAYKNQVQSLRVNCLKMKQANCFALQSIECTDVRSAWKFKKSNLMPEKLILWYEKMVKQNK